MYYIVAAEDAQCCSNKVDLSRGKTIYATPVDAGIPWSHVSNWTDGRTKHCFMLPTVDQGIRSDFSFNTDKVFLISFTTCIFSDKLIAFMCEFLAHPVDIDHS